MDTVELVQGDDWQIDLYLEELSGSTWAAVDITNVSIAVGLKLNDYSQLLTVTKQEPFSAGHVRATLSDTLSAQAPAGVLRAQIEMVSGGAKSSTRPFSIRVLEDIV